MNGFEQPPSKYMRLGFGISNSVRSAGVSCFDLELDAVNSEPVTVSETDLSELLGIDLEVQNNKEKLLYENPNCSTSCAVAKIQIPAQQDNSDKIIKESTTLDAKQTGSKSNDQG